LTEVIDAQRISKRRELPAHFRPILAEDEPVVVKFVSVPELQLRLILLVHSKEFDRLGSQVDRARALALGRRELGRIRSIRDERCHVTRDELALHRCFQSAAQDGEDLLERRRGRAQISQSGRIRCQASAAFAAQVSALRNT